MSGRRLTVRTPEGVTFSWALAGPGVRLLAWAVDAACVAAASVTIQRLVNFLSALSPDTAAALATLIFFILQIGYSMALEWWWRGQTIGKRVLRIRVLDSEGLRLHPSQIVIRNLLRAVDSLPLLYAVGGLFCIWTRNAQRLGDIAAGTVVVRLEGAIDPGFAASLALKYNSLAAWPHLAARLRQRSSPAEAALALSALMRRDNLEPAARLELFEQLAKHFQAKVEFPAEALDGLGDEQYVRDVAEILFRSGVSTA